MIDTKEKILQESLKLFARDGYEGVSVRNIAEAVGVTKGALYKHYSSKQAIFDSIVTRMEELDIQQAEKFDIPKHAFLENPQAYKNLVIRNIKSFTVSQFKYWTEDEFASNFRKMLILEQFRNPKMADLLRKYLTGGVVDYTQDLIKELFDLAGHTEKDSRVLSLEYFAPMHLMMNLYYDMDDKGNATELLERHIDYFMSAYLGWEEDYENEK
ncbi:MAG: TetR/AcrR family transcriptional regulator [Clostridioides sp.]|nr:TetR/AcrR family transcriptional regulator [Clostridioides sp.]